MTDSIKTLRDTSMLVSLSISIWQGKKLDKEASAEMNKAKGASDKASRVIKTLMPANVEHARVRNVMNRSRVYQKEQTARWSSTDDLLAGKNFDNYMKGIAELESEFWTAVRAFVVEFMSFKAQAKLHLGKLYIEDDYPSQSVLESQFTWKVDHGKVPEGEDFRVDVLSSADIAKIQNTINADNIKRLDTAVESVYRRVEEKVEHYRERLDVFDPDKGKQGRPFRDSLTDGLRELIDLVPFVNVANDAELKKVAARVDAELLQHTPQELRDDTRLRERQRDKAAKIVEDMQRRFSHVPSHAITPTTTKVADDDGPGEALKDPAREGGLLGAIYNQESRVRGK